MILFKTALRNIKRDPVMNIIVFIQLVAVFWATMVMVSAISIRYRAYEPLKDIFASKGFYAKFGEMEGAKKIGSGVMEGQIFSVDELNSYINADSVVCLKSAEVVTFREYPNIKVSAPTLMFYDNELIERCKPALKSGRWISPDSDTLEVVITDNNAFGWKLGDTLNLEIAQSTTPRFIEVKVVGIVEDSAEVFGCSRSREESGDTFRYLYNTHNSNNKDNLGKPTMISSSEDLERLFSNVEARIDAVFFIYGRDYSDELIKEKSKMVGQFNAAVVLDLNDINIKSKIYLNEELLKLLPAVVILLVLVVISAVSVSSIAARKRLKDYAEYYVLGLRWKQCAAVSFFQALTSAAAALIVSAAAFFVISFTALSNVITIIIDMRSIFALLGVLLLYLAFSMIMPLIMLNSATPKELLQTE